MDRRTDWASKQRTKHTFCPPPELAIALAEFAAHKRVPQALVVETALPSYLSPDSSERLEAALGRRLDRLSQQMERMERHITITNEAPGAIRSVLVGHNACSPRYDGTRCPHKR
jgi:hypothetical protein